MGCSESALAVECPSGLTIAPPPGAGGRVALSWRFQEPASSFKLRPPRQPATPARLPPPAYAARSPARAQPHGARRMARGGRQADRHFNCHSNKSRQQQQQQQQEQQPGSELERERTLLLRRPVSSGGCHRGGSRRYYLYPRCPLYLPSHALGLPPEVRDECVDGQLQSVSTQPAWPGGHDCPWASQRVPVALPSNPPPKSHGEPSTPQG